MEYSIVDFAWEIIKMDKIIRHQQKEIEHLKHFEKEYFELLDRSKKHTDEMIGNTFKLLLTPGVVKACEDNKTFNRKKGEMNNG